MYEQARTALTKQISLGCFFQVDFWLESRQVGKPVHVRVTPEQYDIVLSYLKEHGMEHSIHIENVRK